MPTAVPAAPETGNAITSPTPAPAAARRLVYIDILRGLACLWVLYHHVSGHWIGPGDLSGHPVSFFLVEFARLGYLGVHLFVGLSGFCLFYPLIRKQDEHALRLNTREFFSRRFRRIAPPYYAAIVFFILVRTQPWGATIGSNQLDFNMVVHLLLIHNLFPSTVALMNPSFWSLALEMQLYLAFPLLIWVARRWGITSVLLLTFLLSTLYQGFCLYRYGANVTWEVGVSRFYALPALWATFASGMAAASLVARPRRNQYRIALCVFALSLPLSLYISLRLPQFGVFREPVHAITCASLLVLLASERLDFLNHVKWLKPLAGLGVISYSLYLLHQPLIVLTQPFIAHMGFQPVRLFALFTVTALPILLALSTVFFYLFERPFMHAPGRQKKAPANARVTV